MKLIPPLNMAAISSPNLCSCTVRWLYLNRKNEIFMFPQGCVIKLIESPKLGELANKFCFNKYLSELNLRYTLGIHKRITRAT